MGDDCPSTVTCIVAPPGSGSTFMAEAVQAAAISFGEAESWTPPMPGLAKNTYEHTMIMDAHNRLLTIVQQTEFSTTPLPIGWEQNPESVAIRQDLQAMLAWSPFPHPDWAWKSPTGARLLPLWETLAVDSGFQLRLVIPVRHPLEVACSLRRIARLPLQQGLRLWATNMLSILDAVERLPHLFCSYGRFLSHPEDEARRLLAFLGRDPTPAAVAAVAAIPDASRRHVGTFAEAELLEVGGDWIADLYRHCLQRCADQPSAPPILNSAAWRQFAELFQFARMDSDPLVTVGTVMFDAGSGFSAAGAHFELLPANPENRFELAIPIPAGTRKVGFIPCSNLGFRCQLESIESETGSHPVLRNNARFKEKGWDVFPPMETPLYEIGGTFAGASTLRLRGLLVVKTSVGERS